MVSGRANHRRRASDLESGGERSYSDSLHEERQQQHALHPAPAPYPASAPNTGTTRHQPPPVAVAPLHHQHPPSQQDPYASRAASVNAQDTLRRRAVASSSTVGNDGRMNDNSSSRLYDDDSVGSDSSFRFTGLEMPSTNNELDTASEHRTARFYNAPSQRLNASMSNIGSGGGGVGGGGGGGGGAVGDLEEGGFRRPRRSSHQPRRNARVRPQKQSAPNRYYIANKNVQITSEWSSPTRQRRSRNSINNNNNGPRNRAAAPGDHMDNDSILVLPSIIPNGSDDYNPHSHPSTMKPPSLPMRKTCVQATNIFCTVGAFKWCILVQLVVVIPLCLYVFDAHAQKRSAKQQLQQYNEEHEHILNQMMWMDQAAKKMKAAHDGAKQGELLESYYDEKDGPTDELRESVHKLRGQMRDMQYRIQQNSKARITEKYGEGPVRVYIHPEPEKDVAALEQQSDNKNDKNGKAEEMTAEIAVELFVEETPHAASTWLYQIERGHWARVQLNWRGETSILSKPGSTVTSAMGDWAQTSRLEFLEKFPVKHCEVSLVQEGQMGALSLKINLVEVPFLEQEEVCIGRLVNDRLVLPRTRDYFMANFSTASNLPESDSGEEGKTQEELRQKLRKPNGRKDELPEEHQIVPPLEEPSEETEDGL